MDISFLDQLLSYAAAGSYLNRIKTTKRTTSRIIHMQKFNPLFFVVVVDSILPVSVSRITYSMPMTKKKQKII